MKKTNTQFLTPTEQLNITNELSDAHKKSLTKRTMEGITEKLMEKLQDMVSRKYKMHSGNMTPQIKNL
jgi:hypothetical protein